MSAHVGGWEFDSATQFVINHYNLLHQLDKLGSFAKERFSIGVFVVTSCPADAAHTLHQQDHKLFLYEKQL